MFALMYSCPIRTYIRSRLSRPLFLFSFSAAVVTHTHQRRPGRHTAHALHAVFVCSREVVVLCVLLAAIVKDLKG